MWFRKGGKAPPFGSVSFIHVMHVTFLHYQQKGQWEISCSPSRLSISHLEFFGLIWLSHHHECDFLDCDLLKFLDGTWNRKRIIKSTSYKTNLRKNQWNRWQRDSITTLKLNTIIREHTYRVWITEFRSWHGIAGCKPLLTLWKQLQLMSAWQINTLKRIMEANRRKSEQILINMNRN